MLEFYPAGAAPVVRGGAVHRHHLQLRLGDHDAETKTTLCPRDKA